MANNKKQDEGVELQDYVPQRTPANFRNINQGTVAVESSRAIAEAQGKLFIAKQFPRSEIDAYQRVMEACQRRELAEKAFYSYNRGGSTVSGPSIRFAEELARLWGNLDYGIKELSRDEDKSEMQAYCWDLETNTISVQNFTNPHVRESGGKLVALTSIRDIYEINANMAARRLRARILAILPSYLVDDAISACKTALAGKADEPLSDRVKKMVTAFHKVGVSRERIEMRLGHSVEDMTADDFSEYIGIYNAIKDGVQKISDWFDAPKEAGELTAELNEVLDGE